MHIDIHTLDDLHAHTVNNRLRQPSQISRSEYSRGAMLRFFFSNVDSFRVYRRMAANVANILIFLWGLYTIVSLGLPCIPMFQLRCRSENSWVWTLPIVKSSPNQSMYLYYISLWRFCFVALSHLLWFINQHAPMSPLQIHRPTPTPNISPFTPKPDFCLKPRDFRILCCLGTGTYGKVCEFADCSCREFWHVQCLWMRRHLLVCVWSVIYIYNIYITPWSDWVNWPWSQARPHPWSQRHCGLCFRAFKFKCVLACELFANIFYAHSGGASASQRIEKSVCAQGIFPIKHHASELEHAAGVLLW